MILKKIVRRIVPRNIWLAVHALRRGYEIAVGPFTYSEDGFATRDQAADFIKEPGFIAAYEAGKNTGSWMRSSEIRWRVKTVLWAAQHAMQYPGDFVECGVNRGGYARSILEFIPFAESGKKMYLLDTFEGIPEKQITAQERENGRRTDTYTPCYESVVETFKNYPTVEIIKGMIPEILNEVGCRKIAYLLIDMNVAEPEIPAAEFFWPRLVTGAVMLLDDYNFTFHPVQRQAFDEFAKQKGIPLLPLPTGQGLIIKA